MKEIKFFLAPDGQDRSAGTLENPLQTIEGVLKRLRDLDLQGLRTAPVYVYLRGGEYLLREPVRFGVEHRAPISFLPYGDEKPFFNGGRYITGFRAEIVRGVPMWTAIIPEVAAGKWYFRELFTNGCRRSRTRLPKSGFFTMEDVPNVDPGISCWNQFFNGSNRFVFREGDVTDFYHPQDVDVIAHHFWVDERMPVDKIDLTGRTVTSGVRSVFVLKNDNDRSFANYYLENTFEGLTAPGEWYLDRTSGKLHYIPMPGESLETTTIIAPFLNQFLLLEGRPEEGQFVENISFCGITFAYADWYHTKPFSAKAAEYFNVEGLTKVMEPCATAAQGAIHVPGAISFRGARNCTLEGCVVKHVGFYGIELRDGCMGNTIAGNEICDIGAGGIRIGGREDFAQPNLQTGNNQVFNNHIHHGGEVFLGGIYLLGVQAGTILRGNYIHNIESCNYGGWGIYLDEGASFVIVENNLVRNVSNQCFNQHYGRENIIRNNIFAFSGDGIISVSRLNVGDPPKYWPISAWTKNSLTFERNIVLSEEKPFHIFAMTPPENRIYSSAANLYWNTGLAERGREVFALSRHGGQVRQLTLQEMQDQGYDIMSLYADPGITLTESGFTLAPDSVACSLGFRPFSVDRAGLLDKDQNISSGSKS